MRALLVLLLITFFGSASARPLTLIEANNLEQRLSDYVEALHNNEMGVLFQSVPVRVIQHMADSAGMTLASFVSSVETQLAQVLEAATFRDVQFLLENIDVTEAMHPDGAVVIYSIIPLSFVMDDSKGQSVRIETQTIVLKENGVWSIARLGEPQQVLILQKVYPFLNSLEAPATTVTVLSD